MQTILAIAGLHWVSTAYFKLGGLLGDGSLFRCTMAAAIASLFLLSRRAFQDPQPQHPPAPKELAKVLLWAAPLHVAVLLLQSHVSKLPSGAWSRWPPLFGLVLALAIWAWIAWGPGRQRHADRFALGAAIILMASFTAGTGALDFSNVFEVISFACGRMLDGLGPYGALVPGPQHVVNYLPGQWLPYMPAVALGLDPRWLNLLYWAVFSAAFLRALPSRQAAWGLPLLAIFFSNPWLIFRHDSYMAALSLPLGLALWARARHKAGVEAVAWGWAASSSPFFWPVLPVLAAWRLRRPEPFRFAAFFILGAALVAGPFVLGDPQGMARGFFGTWEGRAVAAPTHFALAHWLPHRSALTLLQALAVGIWALWAWRQKGREGAFWAAAAGAQASFLLLLFHVDHYYWILTLMLMLIAWTRRAAD